MNGGEDGDGSASTTSLKGAIALVKTIPLFYKKSVASHDMLYRHVITQWQQDWMLTCGNVGGWGGVGGGGLDLQ